MRKISWHIAVNIALVLAVVAIPVVTLFPQPAYADPPPAETEWVHYRWEKSGRTLYNPDTGQYMYVSYIGQANVDLGDGDYAPYVWDPVPKTAKFADCELRFFNPHFEFWRNGEKLTAAKFHLYKKLDKSWVNIPLFFDGLTVSEGDEYATATLKLKDENQNEITADIRFGLFHYINLDFDVKVNAEGEYRLEMENTGLSGDPVEIHSGTGIKGLEEREDRVIGVVYEKIYFRWSYDEAPDQLYLHEVEADGSETSKKIVELGNLSPGESKSISPDSWGPTGIKADADDGEEDGRIYEGADPVHGGYQWKTDGYYHNGDNRFFSGYYETYSSPFEPAYRFLNVEISGIAEDGCKIEVYGLGGGTITTGQVLSAIDEANPAAPDAADNTTWPSNRTRTTAKVSWNLGSISDWQTSPEIKSIIQELIDSYSYTGTQAIALSWWADTWTDGTHSVSEGYGHVGGHPAQLTIVYTPPSITITAPTGGTDLVLTPAAADQSLITSTGNVTSNVNFDVSAKDSMADGKSANAGKLIEYDAGGIVSSGKVLTNAVKVHSTHAQAVASPITLTNNDQSVILNAALGTDVDLLLITQQDTAAGDESLTEAGHYYKIVITFTASEHT